MAETKDIIDALSDGDNIGAEKAFKDKNTKIETDKILILSITIMVRAVGLEPTRVLPPAGF